MTIEDFSDRDGWIWQNGTLVPWRDAKVHVLTHTLHYGVGCFEGVRAYDTPNGPCIFRLHEHTRRLFNSAHILGLKIPYTPEEVNQAQLDVFKANELAEALMLDNEGYVTEGTGENIFIVKEGVLHTPELSSCLDGITRNTIFHLAGEMGIDVLERRITRDEVYICDEAFFTGTAAEVLPIRQLDGRTIGTGKRGPLTERLQSVYFDQVRGQRASFRQWHTPVNGQAA